MLQKWKETPRRIRKRIVWIFALLMVLLNVGACINLNDTGGCISITFDKLPMLLVDRAVLGINEKEYVISDIKFARKIAQESIVASNTDLCIHDRDRWIDLYVGDVRVRRIYWEEEHDSFLVYEADGVHWVLFSAGGEGFIFPSDDLIDTLESIIA